MSKRKVTSQMRQGRNLSFFELEELCDDPIRDITGQEVQAVLKPVKSGFALSARDGAETYQINDMEGRQARFRTIDSAVERLSDVPHLCPEIILDASCQFSEGRT